MATKYHVPDHCGTPRSDVERPGSASTLEFVRQKTSPTNNGINLDTKALLAIPERSHNNDVMGPYQSDASKFVNGSPSKQAVDVKIRVPQEDEGEPRKYEHSMSSENKANQHTTKTKPVLMRRTSTLLAPPTLMGTAEIEKQVDAEAPIGFLRPNTVWQFAWSYLIMIISIYNTFTIPYRMAFWESPIHMEPDVILMLVLDCIGDVCFFVEMYRASRTGYVDNGVVIYDKKLIWKRYLSSWFIVDLFTCLPFDLIQLGYLEVIPTVRVVKILRIFQVLHHYNVIEENTTVSLQFRVGKLLFYTGVLSHWAACIKYHVILGDHDHRPQSIRSRVVGFSAFGRYLQSMYWATGAMTGRDDTNPPENLIDAGFTVFMMVVGILWLAYIIASLETFAHDGNNSGARFQAKVAYVTQFMHQFSLPKDIQDKVKAYYSYLWSSSLRFETDHFLSTLPVTLQTDVNLSMHRVLERAEIFEFVDSGFLAYVVQTLTTTVAIPGEIICHVDMSSHEMWFISEGEVEICIGAKLAAIAKLREGDHFGEYGIFAANGTRTATARSVGYCTLLVLTSANLQKALNLFPSSDAAVRAYVEEHRNKTLLQERNFLGLGNTKGGKGGKQNEKLKKLITVDDAVQSSNKAGAWTISPQSKLYERWQALYFLFMAWNGIVLPLRIGFYFEDVNPYIMTIDYLADLFLILDIALNFRLRYIQGGAEIMDPVAIRRKYIRGWFIPHVIASVPLDFIMIHTGMNPLYRLNRILRLAHVHGEILAKLKDATHYNLLSLLYLFFNFLFLSHWAASIYFAFTRFEGFQPDLDGHPDYSQWRPSAELERDPNILWRYFQSQYYAMALLAGIGRHLYPPSSYDVCLSLFVMLTGVFVVSYLIGKVGHLIFNLNASAAEFKAEAAFVSQLLEYRKVSSEVSIRVTEYMKHVWTSQKGIDPNVAIRGLPMAIRTDIMMYLFEDMIRKVPRFKDLDDNFVRQLVTELTFVELPAGEFVFRQGQIGDCMYFISKGLVEILFDAPLSPALAEPPSPAAASLSSHQLKIIGQGSFFGEGALFAGTRAASIRTRTPVRLLALSETSFQRVMHVHPHFAEKIMFLNQQRQKKMEQKVIASLHHPVPQAADLARKESRAQPSQNNHLSPRPPAAHDSLSPRNGRPSQGNNAPRTRQSIIADRPLINVGQNTGLAGKVERLLQKEREKEESRKSGSAPGTPVRSVMTASAVATPNLASAAATSTSTHPVSTPQWNAGNPPTLTITTTHTIALHDGHGAGLGAGGLGASTSTHELHGHGGHGHGSTHIISDIEINRAAGTSSATVANTTSSSSAGAARSSPSHTPAVAPAGPFVDQERSVHAGVPPGYTDVQDTLPSPSLNRPADPAVVVLNPTRTSYNPNNPPAPSASARERRAQSVHQGNSSMSISASTPDSTNELMPRAEVGGLPYPSSAVPHSQDPSILSYPRDPAAALVGAAPLSASQIEDPLGNTGGLGGHGHSSQGSVSSLGGIGSKNNMRRMSAQRR